MIGHYAVRREEREARDRYTTCTRFYLLPRERSLRHFFLFLLHFKVHFISFRFLPTHSWRWSFVLATAQSLGPPPRPPNSHASTPASPPSSPLPPCSPLRQNRVENPGICWQHARYLGLDQCPTLMVLRRGVVLCESHGGSRRGRRGTRSPTRPRPCRSIQFARLPLLLFLFLHFLVGMRYFLFVAVALAAGRCESLAPCRA